MITASITKHHQSFILLIIMSLICITSNLNFNLNLGLGSGLGNLGLGSGLGSGSDSTSINNIGANIKAGGSAYLNAAGSINNQALVNYKINGKTATASQALTSNANNIRSTLISQGNIESGGNLVLVAKNNINNVGSNLKATGSALLQATNGDINITTAELRDKTTTSWGSKRKGGTSIADNTTNIGSNITAGGNAQITVGNDLNILAAENCEHEMLVEVKWRGETVCVPLEQLDGFGVDDKIKP